MRDYMRDYMRGIKNIVELIKRMKEFKGKIISEELARQ